MTISPARPVLVDTNVASYMLVRSGPYRDLWAASLIGRVQVIAVQSRAELLALPKVSNWGPRKSAELREKLAGVPAIPVDERVQEEYAQLKAWGKAKGHAIGSPAKCADRWIAATAIAHDLELATGDSDFTNIAGLQLFPMPE
jgi:predicted nucleic acid-binding protein